MKKFRCNQRKRGLTLVELLVIIAIFALMAMLIYPGGRQDKARALRVQCVNNLKQTGVAFDTWAKDHGEKFPMEISQTNGGTMEFVTGANEWRHFQIMSNELITPWVLICPADNARMRATNFTFLNNSNLSFFINVDYSRPNLHALWSGDRNLTNASPIRDGILELTTNKPAVWTAEMHKKVGNLLLFDGSVQQASEAGLRNAIANSGASTNRLQMPVLAP
jgi:prepilin-type N-terminal cleavage/methylation domain-containing protein